MGRAPGRRSRAPRLLAAAAVLALALAASPPWQRAAAQTGGAEVLRALTQISGAVVAGEHLFFVADDGTGPEVWVTDGTSERTRMVRDIWTKAPVGTRGPPRFPSPSALAAAGERVVFNADDGEGRDGVWGADARDAWFLDGDAAPAGLASDHQAFGAVGLVLGFTSDNRVGLWSTNGLPGGTTRLGEVEPWSGSLRSRGSNEAVRYFGGRSGGAAFGLWRTDGRPRGTLPLADGLGYVSAPVSLGTGVYFTTWTAWPITPTRYELRRYDIETERMTIVRSLAPQTRIVAAISNRLVLSLDGVDRDQLVALRDGSTEFETLNSIDATLVCCSDERVFDHPNGLLFAGRYAGNDGELWTTDGTPSGTRPLKEVRNIRGHFVRCGDRATFEVRWNATATMWVSDGTVEGTREIPGTADADALEPLGCLGETLVYRTTTSLNAVVLPARR